jgi:RecB family exonuclease
MDKETIVLPSARAIRHEQFSQARDTLFLPDYITMSDFISKLCLVPGYKIVDDDSRVLLLLEASDFKGFENLQIERNFFTFTKNSAYIFKFFEELSAEMYDISALNAADVYAEYEEHITILQELYRRYERLCAQKKLLDRIFLPSLYTFNEAFAKSREKVTIVLDGYLTNFEFALLRELTAFTEVQVHLSTTDFNRKMQKKFADAGFELAVGYEYILSLNSGTILSKNKREQLKNVSCQSFSETLLQIGFIKEKIYEFVAKGYEAENIAVILPNEAIAQTIRSFDEKANLNFAMGESFSKSGLYVKLNATLKALEQDSKENEARLERVGDELYLLLHQNYYKKVCEIAFVDFMQEIKPFFTNKGELKVFEEEIFRFEKLLPFMQDMSVKSLLSIFMQRLSGRTIDDVRGGKVTVMGVLETRSIHFDGVIIIDFDDKNVPKRSDKDMFLNTKIREMANLPTMSDRENLQKHYYEMLLSHSKEVAISFVSSSQSSGSRFLKQLGIKEQNKHNEIEYAEILFQRSPKARDQEKEIIGAYSFKNVALSATRLKTYLSCKRKYYFKYVKNIQNHEIPKDMPQEYEIGNVVHQALKSVYAKQNSYSDARKLKRDIDNALDEYCGKSELDRYLVALQKRRLDAFVENEIQRFHKGWQVIKTEEFFQEPFAGITIAGQIDRVDKRENVIEVLDYKTGSYTLNNKNNFMDTKDFQLEFYYLLAGGLGNVEGCAFYDLKEAKIVPEAFLQEKVQILQSHIKDLLKIEEINYEKTEDTKECLFCEYRVMCGRE